MDINIVTNFFAVFLGSALGGIFRYYISGIVARLTSGEIPFGTLAVNIVGSFIAGFIIFYIDDRGLLSKELKLFLVVGFCGGFTTFSTFSLETIRLLQDSEYFYAFINITLNNALSLGGALAALYLSKLMR